MIANIAADHRINKYFAHADVPRLRHMLADQICSAIGGGCLYWGKDMKTAHAGMHIKSRDFNALVQDLGMALAKYKVPAKEQHELVAVLARSSATSSDSEPLFRQGTLDASPAAGQARQRHA